MLFGVSCQECAHKKKMQQRTAAMLPRLRGAAKATGDVLTDTRQATQRGFDVLKYDLYQKGAPKTPEAAKNVAQRIVKAAMEDREKIIHPIINASGDMTSDTRTEDEHLSSSTN